MINENPSNNKNTRKVTKNTGVSFPTIGKLPPQALELEEAVLGACMLDKNASLSIIEKLKPEIFYDTRHQIISEAIIRLVNLSKPVDILTITNELRKMGLLEMAGGPFYISELTNKVATAANIEYHTHILYQKYIQRELIRVATEISNKAFDEASDAFDILDDAERSLFNISDSTLRKDTEVIANVVKETIAHLNDLKEKKEGEFTGVPSGFLALDTITSGFQKSDLVIVAARPGMGKTAFTLSLARNSAVQFKQPIAFFSLEMSSVQLVQRLIASETDISSQKLREGKLTDGDWLKSLSMIPLS
jgi:replicative DNA helicase